MKNRIYNTGIGATLLVFLGVLFKMQHWPGASILLLSGMALLLFIFLPLALRSNYRAEGAGTPLLHIVTWITCLVVFSAMIFKIFHWSGAGWMLMIAIPFPYVVFLPVYLAVTSKKPDHNIYNTVAILFLLAIISAQSAMLSLSVSKEKIVDTLRLSETTDRASEALVNITQRGTKSELNTAIDEAINLIGRFESMMLNQEGITPAQWSADRGILTDLSLRRKAAGKITGTEGETYYRELMESLDGIGTLLRAAPGNTLSDDDVRLLLTPDHGLGESYEWRKGNFGVNIQPWAHVWLDGLQNRLMMIME
ncbi:MAG: hypothetical protein FJY11_04380 [Bacteroidetes bacterium]|nr:hypothetical protein [Bacteroidota bacterium]